MSGHSVHLQQGGTPARSLADPAELEALEVKVVGAVLDHRGHERLFLLVGGVGLQLVQRAEVEHKDLVKRLLLSTDVVPGAAKTGARVYTG